MRLARRGALALGLAASLAGCAGGGVDPEDAARGMALGGVWGSALGTAVGVSFAINPAIGAAMGAATGAGLGVASGLMSAQRAVSYETITPPSEAVMPGFYDGWAPGSHPPSLGVMAPPPRAAGAG
jgi:hypothetical protein